MTRAVMRDKVSAIFQCVIVMGVSGCGKTTVGKMLAERLDWDFIESDAFHSAEDVRKMSNGIPLTDDDRWPWLERLNAAIKEQQIEGRSCVVACSALKESYRELLCKGVTSCLYVYLKGDYPLIEKRMRQRAHFMKAGMLQSQFDALEEPTDAITIDIRRSPDMIVEAITRQLTQP